MYSVFGDESADESKARVFAVTGVFGSESDWFSLKEAWIDRTGGRIFHATDCDTNQGECASNSDADNKRLYKDLTQLLCCSKLMGRSHAVDLAGWRNAFPGTLDAGSDMPYYTCFRNVVQECGDLALLSIPQEKVEFTFDHRLESNYNAGILYDYMAKLKSWPASSYLQEKISFASRKYIGIQAADLVARETMKHLDNIVGPTKRNTRRSYSALLETKRFRFTFFDKQWFADFRSDFARVASSCGVDPKEYRAWLDERGLADNISNRHRYMFEKHPPTRDAPMSE